MYFYKPVVRSDLDSHLIPDLSGEFHEGKDLAVGEWPGRDGSMTAAGLLQLFDALTLSVKWEEKTTLSFIAAFPAMRLLVAECDIIKPEWRQRYAAKQDELSK